MASPTRTETARNCLTMLREDHAKLDRSDAYYVPLAAREGLSMAEIAALSGLTSARVSELIEVSPDGA